MKRNIRAQAGTTADGCSIYPKLVKGLYWQEWMPGSPQILTLLPPEVIFQVGSLHSGTTKLSISPLGFLILCSLPLPQSPENLDLV